MEAYQEARDAAIKHLQIADHMLTQTYNLVKDPKILMAVADNLFRTVASAIDAVLLWERLFKRIPPYHESFQNKLSIFEGRSVRRYNFPKEYSDLARDLAGIIEKHKQSPVEFSRKDKFMICSDDYDVKSLDEKELAAMIVTAKAMVHDMQKMVNRHERLFT